MMKRSTRAAGVIMALSLISATTPVALGVQLFAYSIDFKVSVRGRDMQSPTGTFCNTFTATFVERADKDPNIFIALWEPPFDHQVGINVAFSTNGQAHRFCWAGFLPNHTYFFKYTKSNNGFVVRGLGTVADR